MTPPDDRFGEAALRRRYQAAMSDEAAGPHPSEDEWVRLACDELDADARARLADHVAACRSCADTFRAVGAVRDGAAAFDPAAPAAVVSAPRRAWWPGLAAAAAVALAVGGTAWWRLADAPPPTPAATPAQTSAAPAAPPVVAPPMTPPAWAVLPAAPAVSLPASLTLVMRGAAGPNEAFMTAFGAAITPYREGRYAEAAGALAPVVAAHPRIAEAWFYLGVSRLLSDRAADAVEPLRRARASDLAGAEARWLEAVALARAGRRDEAMAALEALCGAAMPTSARACEAVGRGR